LSQEMIENPDCLSLVSFDKLPPQGAFKACKLEFST
jgi:hypothetical protein